MDSTVLEIYNTCKYLKRDRVHVMEFLKSKIRKNLSSHFALLILKTNDEN